MEAKIAELNSLAQYPSHRTEEFQRQNHLKIRFKPIYEERSLVRFVKHLIGSSSRMIIKVYILCESANLDSTWKAADRYFLTVSECERVYEQLAASVSRGVSVPVSPESCCICLEHSLERRFRECGVSAKQHGFCTRCIELWLQGNDTCPVCRRDVKGDTFDRKMERLSNTVRCIPSAQVQAALLIILHRSV